MQNKFSFWFIRNQHRITWFVIGMMAMSAVDYLARGDYFNAGLCAFIALANYVMERKELV